VSLISDKRMKVLFDHPQPFSLAHGGLQVQIEQTKQALESIGVAVEPLRWWDQSQSGDLIHYFGRAPALYIQQAQEKGIKVVMAELLGSLATRPILVRAIQKLLMQLARTALPRQFTSRLAWESYRTADAYVALTQWERYLMIDMFGASAARVHVVPNGVEEIFLNGDARPRGEWLVCTATIRDVKRVLEVAKAAVIAQTPIWFIGKPYSESDEYAQNFRAFAGKNNRLIRYDGAIENRTTLADIYRSARGFVLLSAWETLSIAALEAAACGCPLLLSDQAWARSVFDGEASLCPVASPRRTASALRRFYDAAPTLPVPKKPKSWTEIAAMLKRIYLEI
jgi:glycosyltransferase involved in cell wall biosynthesis